MEYQDEDSDVVLAAVGKKIAYVALVDNRLEFKMESGYRFYLDDDGQSCCETRYLQTDDDLTQYVGAYLLGIDKKEAPDIEDEHGETHEVQFLEVETTMGSFTVATHNGHNGYYGGFIIRAVKVVSKE